LIVLFAIGCSAALNTALRFGKDEMRNAMRTTGKICFYVIALAGSALAQSLASGPLPAVAGPAYDVSIGYAHLTMPIASAGHVNLEGLDVGGSIALGSRWGAMMDSEYLRTSNVLGTPHQGYMLSFQAGPKFYLFERRNTRVFVDALAGAALVDGAVPISTTSYFHGWLARPAYAFGGGVEQSLMGPLALRVTGDYLRTTFYDAAGAAQSQNNLRLTASFVFRLKEHRRAPNSRQ
jgi:hypothetical protein